MTILDIEPIELLDFDPAFPCECASHQLTGPSNGPAVLVVYWKPTFPCGCASASSTFYCQECWAYINGSSSSIGCNQCFAHIGRLYDCIDHIETLKK